MTDADKILAMTLIQTLRFEECDSVTILCDNPDGPPNNAVECSGLWTSMKDLRFEGSTLIEALRTAVRHRALHALADGPVEMPQAQLNELLLSGKVITVTTFEDHMRPDVKWIAPVEYGAAFAVEVQKEIPDPAAEPHDRVWQRGSDARLRGAEMSANPYRFNSPSWRTWKRGWLGE